jgi:hypothetical protein
VRARALIAGVLCAAATAAGCGAGSSVKHAAPAARDAKPSATPSPRAAAAPPVVSGGGGAGPSPAELKLVRAANAICRKVGPIPPPSASTSLDARRADMAREIRGLERLSAKLRALHPETPRLERLLGEYVARTDAQVLLDRRIGQAAEAGDAQSVEVGMSENAGNRKARNAIRRKLGLSRCLRAREPI